MPGPVRYEKKEVIPGLLALGNAGSTCPSCLSGLFAWASVPLQVFALLVSVDHGRLLAMAVAQTMQVQLTFNAVHPRSSRTQDQPG